MGMSPAQVARLEGMGTAEVEALVDTIYGLVRHGYLLAPADG